MSISKSLIMSKIDKQSVRTAIEAKEIVTATNTSMLLHCLKGTNHQAQAHVTCHL